MSNETRRLDARDKTRRDDTLRTVDEVEQLSCAQSVEEITAQELQAEELDAVRSRQYDLRLLDRQAACLDNRNVLPLHCEKGLAVGRAKRDRRRKWHAEFDQAARCSQQ